MHRSSIEAYLRGVVGPDVELVATRPLGIEDHDTGISSLTHLSVRVGGEAKQWVLRQSTSTPYGTEHRPDRAREILQAHEVYGRIPRHPQPLALGVRSPDGRLDPIPTEGEFVLLHTFVEGEAYVGDLIRCLRSGEAGAGDLDKAAALGEYLVELHGERRDDQRAYRRAMRDVVAGGNGVMAVLGGYADEVRGAFHDRLGEILRDFVGRVWAIEQRPGVLRRMHGDFHPLNVLFDGDGRPAAIDATGSGWGDPAFDVGTMYANYQVLYNAPGRLGSPAGRALAERFLEAYVAGCPEPEALHRVLPIALARAVLIMATPAFFPQRSMDERGRLIDLAGRILATEAFTPALFAPESCAS